MDVTSNIDILKNFEILNQLTMFQESLVIYKLSLWKSGFSDSYEDEILALFTTYMSYINYCEVYTFYEQYKTTINMKIH